VRRRWLGLVLLAPLLMGGCSAAAGSATAEPAPTGSPWVLVKNGKAVASSAPKGYVATPRTFPTGFLPRSSASPRPAPTPTGGCSPIGGDRMNFASVVPASTSAAVTFYDRGGADLVEYRVTAVPQDLQVGAQREVGWTVLTPGASCGFRTATVVGLDPGTDYVFSVDAVTRHRERDGTYGSTVARSAVVRTT
jgi:Fibronectin type III domain